MIVDAPMLSVLHDENDNNGVKGNVMMMIIIIIIKLLIITTIMEICKAPTLQLKALNTHNVHRDEKCYQQFNKKLIVIHDAGINKGSSITMCKMHTHTHCTEGQRCLTHFFPRSHIQDT